MPRRKVSPPVPEQPAPIEAKRSRKFSTEQVRAQLSLVERLLASSVPAAQVEAQLRVVHGVRRARATQLIARVRAHWAEEDADKREAWKAAQLRSLDRSLQQIEGLISQHLQVAEKLREDHARGERLKTRIKDPPAFLYREKREYHKLRAEMTGTLAPQQVQVTTTVQVAAAVQVAIASLTGEEAAGYLAQLAEMERAAAEAKRVGLLTEGSAQ